MGNVRALQHVHDFEITFRRYDCWERLFPTSGKGEAQESLLSPYPFDLLMFFLFEGCFLRELFFRLEPEASLVL